jgi:lysophospholipase
MSDPRFAQPPGFAWGYFRDTASGARIRYGHAGSAGEAKLTLVMAGGFGEPAEKYFEVMNERIARGQAVWFMDWRGQGGSDRYLSDPMKSHHAGYEGCIATLLQFVHEVVKPAKQTGADSAPLPLVLMAHSMGAHTGLRTLAAYPGIFSRAVFTDPMFRFRTGRVPRRTARLLAETGRRVGWFERYVPGGGPWIPGEDVFEGNQKTSDPARFKVQPDLYLNQPELRMGSPTFGWVWHGFRSCDILCAPGTLKSIKTPILMQISGDNEIVDRETILSAADLLPDCRRVDIPEAKHEIWMERKDLRARMLSAMDDFLAQGLTAAAPATKG